VNLPQKPALCGGIHLQIMDPTSSIAETSLDKNWIHVHCSNNESINSTTIITKIPTLKEYHSTKYSRTNSLQTYY
jgi:hypothetical protein